MFCDVKLEKLCWGSSLSSQKKGIIGKVVASNSLSLSLSLLILVGLQHGRPSHLSTMYLTELIILIGDLDLEV